MGEFLCDHRVQVANAVVRDVNQLLQKQHATRNLNVLCEELIFRYLILKMYL